MRERFARQLDLVKTQRPLMPARRGGFRDPNGDQVQDQLWRQEQLWKRKQQVLERVLRGDGDMPFRVFACPGAKSRVTLSHVEPHEEY